MAKILRKNEKGEVYLCGAGEDRILPDVNIDCDYRRAEVVLSDKAMWMSQDLDSRFLDTFDKKPELDAGGCWRGNTLDQLPGVRIIGSHALSLIYLGEENGS